jgi:hypothetical protein
MQCAAQALSVVAANVQYDVHLVACIALCCNMLHTACSMLMRNSRKHAALARVVMTTPQDLVLMGTMSCVNKQMHMLLRTEMNHMWNLHNNGVVKVLALQCPCFMHLFLVQGMDNCLARGLIRQVGQCSRMLFSVSQQYRMFDVWGHCCQHPRM